MDILKSNLDRRTGKNSYHIEVYNNLQKLFLVGNSFYHPTAKAVGFPFSVKIQKTQDIVNRASEKVINYLQLSIELKYE